VDVFVPEVGFEATEDRIVAFLKPLVGSFTLYATWRGNDRVARYCFRSKADADAFRAVVEPAQALH
jgi:hypothetical protein